MDASLSPDTSRSPVKYLSRLALGQGVTQAGLSNGMTVLVRENHAAPVATARCFVRNTGAAFEGAYLGAGISHLLEHLVALGSTRKRSEQELQRLLDSLGGRTNAFTSSDRTGYYIDCPAERLELAIELVADSLQSATIPEREFARELGVVQRELEMGQADRGRMLHQTLKSLVYAEHPLRHPTIGYLPVVQRLSCEDVRTFYRERYVPQNMVFVVVGDVETDRVLEAVLANFRDFHRTPERAAALPVEPPQLSPRAANLEMEGQTTHFSLGWPTVALQHPDLYALDVISDLLTNGDSSRLGSRLRIDQPLAVDVSSLSYTPSIAPGWFEISIECRPDQLDACRRIIREQVEQLQRETIADRELDQGQAAEGSGPRVFPADGSSSGERLGGRLSVDPRSPLRRALRRGDSAGHRRANPRGGGAVLSPLPTEHGGHRSSRADPPASQPTGTGPGVGCRPSAAGQRPGGARQTARRRAACQHSGFRARGGAERRTVHERPRGSCLPAHGAGHGEIHGQADLRVFRLHRWRARDGQPTERELPAVFRAEGGFPARTRLRATGALSAYFSRGGV